MVCHLQKHQEGRSEARFIASYVSKTTYWSNIPFVWNEWFCTCHSIGRDSWFNLQHFHRCHNLFLLAFILSFGRSTHDLQILWTSIRPEKIRFPKKKIKISNLLVGLLSTYARKSSLLFRDLQNNWSSTDFDFKMPIKRPKYCSILKNLQIKFTCVVTQLLFVIEKKITRQLYRFTFYRIDRRMCK